MNRLRHVCPSVCYWQSPGRHTKGIDFKFCANKWKFPQTGWYWKRSKLMRTHAHSKAKSECNFVSLSKNLHVFLLITNYKRWWIKIFYISFVENSATYVREMDQIAHTNTRLEVIKFSFPNKTEFLKLFCIYSANKNIFYVPKNALTLKSVNTKVSMGDETTTIVVLRIPSVWISNKMTRREFNDDETE